MPLLALEKEVRERIVNGFRKEIQRVAVIVAQVICNRARFLHFRFGTGSELFR